MKLTKISSLLTVGACLALAVGASACKVDKASDNAGVSSGAANSSSLPFGNPGTVNQAGFFVQVSHLSNPDAQFYFHEQSNFANNCIALQADGRTAAADLFCILDMAELDLFTTDITLNFNAPSGMCNYVVIKPYVFYTDQPGSIPAGATLEVDKDATGKLLPGGCKPSAGSHLSCDTAGNPICDFDWGKQPEPVGGGPNCCEGSFTLNVETQGPSGFTPSITQMNYGGHHSACLNGPAMTTQAKDQFGNPMGTIMATFSGGVNSTYTINNPEGKGFGTNIYNTNYFQPTAFGSPVPNPSDFFLNGTIPPDPNNRIKIPAEEAAQPYYEFDCLDAAQDYIARLRILIRAWDEVSQWNIGAAGIPYEGVGAPNEPNFLDPIHDRSVWNDHSQILFPGPPVADPWPHFYGL